MSPALTVLALALATAQAPRFPAPDRPVAAIVAPMWWSESQRDAANEAGQLVRGLAIRAGMAVADVGAGSGYHTVRLSPVVGPTGRIYAQDVTAEYLDGLRKTLAQKGLINVEVVLGTTDDPGLPPASVDRAILVHMYHEIAQPYGLLWNLAGSMKAGGRVGVVDLDSPIARHGTPTALLRCEFEAVGYRQRSLRTLEGGVGYLAVFEAPSLASRPAPEAIKPCLDAIPR